MSYNPQLKLFRVFLEGREHFFQNKMAAKEFGRENGLKGVVVHRGPDHERGPSDGTTKPTQKKAEWW